MFAVKCEIDAEKRYKLNKNAKMKILKLHFSNAVKAVQKLFINISVALWYLDNVTNAVR